MKKTLAYTLAVALLLSLAACGKSQADQQDTSQPNPAAISTQADVSTPEPPAETEPEPPTQTQAVPEQLTSNEEKQELSGDELIQYFKIAYIGCTAHTMHFSLEDAVNFELDYIKIIANRDDQLLPFDYADQYRAWRPVDVQEASQQQSTEATLTFTDCNETVYATGTVNLRSGPDTSYDKVGSLNKGNSVIRTGIGTGDYSSWSRVRLSDGSEVYVASNYLSTVKPAATSNNNGSNTSGNSTPQSGLDSQSSSKPASGGLDIYGGFNTYEEYIEDLQRKLPHLTLEQIKEAWPDQATLHVDEAVYNQDIKDNLLHN